MAAHVLPCGCFRTYRVRWIGLRTPLWWDRSIRGNRGVRVVLDGLLVRGRGEFCERH